MKNKTNKYAEKLKSYLDSNKFWNLLVKSYNYRPKGALEWAIIQLAIDQIQIAIKNKCNWAIRGIDIAKAVGCDFSYVYKVLKKYGNQFGIQQIDNKEILSKNLLSKTQKRFSKFRIKHSIKTWMFIFKNKTIELLNKFLNHVSYLNPKMFYLGKTKIYKELNIKLSVEFNKNKPKRIIGDDLEYDDVWKGL